MKSQPVKTAIETITSTHGSMPISVENAPDDKRSRLTGFVNRISDLLEPVSSNKRKLLKQRWNQLPEHLRLPNQVIGKHWVQCGYTMGPSYCSFGCSHCYLPKNANRVPLTPLEQMKAQIDAQRNLMGEGGNLQITGGDVIDAYWRAGKSEELIEVLQYATQKGLVPMLMTHGQILLENPQYFVELVNRGGLRKLSFHIDITMAGRPGYPVKQLLRECQLNKLRDQFVDLVISTRKQTGKLITAAQTVTAVSKNIDSLGDVLKWLMTRKENMDICRTISFQPEANVGRTLISVDPVTPQRVWDSLQSAVGKNLVRDHLVYGHPDCSSTATLLVRPRDGQIAYLNSTSHTGQKFWTALLNTFGGISASCNSPGRALVQKLGAILRRPGVLFWGFMYIGQLLKEREVSPGFIFSAATGGVKGFNLVMHNFLSESELQTPRGPNIEQRLKACAFKGVVEQNGEWKAISMCEMNATLRPEIYKRESATRAIPDR